jgi:probable F420-dependent oxidoreductase
VRIGVSTFPTDRTIHPVDLARALEERGFESLWLPEHSHIPVSRRTPWPGSLTNEPLPDYYSRPMDQFVALSMAAAVTSKLVLGTSVTLVHQRDPIWLAKQVATLDHLSGGRVVLGIGFGWNREEAENHWRGTAITWGQRWDLVRERVAAMRALWTDEVASYEGELVSFEPSWAWPKPAQPGGPKVIIGGGWGPRLMSHVAEWGDGWMPISARGTLRERLNLLAAACEKVGRDPSAMEIDVTGAKADLAALEGLAAEGVTRAILTLWPAPADEHLRQLDDWAALAARFPGP